MVRCMLLLCCGYGLHLMLAPHKPSNGPAAKNFARRPTLSLPKAAFGIKYPHRGRYALPDSVTVFTQQPVGGRIHLPPERRA